MSRLGGKRRRRKSRLLPITRKRRFLKAFNQQVRGVPGSPFRSPHGGNRLAHLAAEQAAKALRLNLPRYFDDPLIRVAHYAQDVCHAHGLPMSGDMPKPQNFRDYCRSRLCCLLQRAFELEPMEELPLAPIDRLEVNFIREILNSL